MWELVLCGSPSVRRGIMCCHQARGMRRRGNENYEVGGRDAAAGEVAVIGECAWGVCARISCTGDADLLKCSCL